MKKVILGSLICVCLSTQAEPFQSRKPVMCDEQIKVLDALKTKFEEKIQWIARDAQNANVFILTVNEKEGTWTMLETNGQVACILGVGDKSTLVLGDKI